MLIPSVYIREEKKNNNKYANRKYLFESTVY